MMTKEFDIYGVYVPPIVIWGIVSYILVKIIHVLLSKKNFYGSDAEQQVFDVSLFVIFISLLSFVF
jgi:uncharacterized membrane protein